MSGNHTRLFRKKAKRKGPKRACESCGELYHPRAKACPKCGVANPVFETSPGRSRKSSGLPLVEAVEFVEKAGGLKAARAALEKIERIKGL